MWRIGVNFYTEGFTDYMSEELLGWRTLKRSFASLLRFLSQLNHINFNFSLEGSIPCLGTIGDELVSVDCKYSIIVGSNS